MLTNDAPPPGADRDVPIREFDNLNEAQHMQMAEMTGVMRRVEEIADRLLGAQPEPATTNDEKPYPLRTGWFGGLRDSLDMRAQIITRTAAALTRIEKVL